MTPLDNRISKLRQRTQQPGASPRLGHKLDRLRTRQFVNQQRHAPPSQLPFNAESETTIGNLNRNFNDTQSALNAQQLNTEQTYGFTDASNPYNRAALLQQAYQRNRSSTLNAYAGRGQLYSGSLNNANAYDYGNFDRSYDALSREFQGEEAGIAQKRLAAQRTLEEGTQQARAKALEAALSEPVDPTEAPPLPGAVARTFRRRIKDAHGKKRAALKNRLQQLRNPNPIG